MPRKIYTEVSVLYYATGKKWTFNVASEKFAYSTPVMPGGKGTAGKIARIINSSIVRNAKKGKIGIVIDNLARANMVQVIERAQLAIKEEAEDMSL